MHLSPEHMDPAFIMNSSASISPPRQQAVEAQRCTGSASLCVWHKHLCCHNFPQSPVPRWIQPPPWRQSAKPQTPPPQTLKTNNRSHKIVQTTDKQCHVYCIFVCCSERDMTNPYLKGAARHTYNCPTQAQRTKLAMVKVPIMSSTTSSSPQFFLTFFPTHFWTFFLTHILWHSRWHIFWHISDTYLHNILSDRSCDTSSDISLTHIFTTSFLTDLVTGSRLRSGTQHWSHRIAVEVRHATLISQDRGWGPARNTDLTRSRLRSGTQHWSHRIAVEVRHATLFSQDRGWGPARNTDLTGSRWRSGTQHWSHRIADEVRHATLISPDRGWGPARNTDLARSRLKRRGGGGRGGGQEEGRQADIKSNNPHLTGGEKTYRSPPPSFMTKQKGLPGGFKHFCSPRSLGKWSMQFDEHIFFKWVAQPPTRRWWSIKRKTSSTDFRSFSRGEK